MRQLIVLCLLTVNVINSAKIANDTGLKELKELLKDGSPKTDSKNLLRDAVRTGRSKAYKHIEDPIKRINVVNNWKYPTHNNISDHSESTNSTPLVVYRILPKKAQRQVKYPENSTIYSTDEPTTPKYISSPQKPYAAEFDKIDDYVTEPVELGSDEEEPLASKTPDKSKPGVETSKNNDRFLDELPNSTIEDSRDKDESKKDNNSQELLSQQGIHSQPSTDGTPEEEDPLHSVSLADVVLNFRKAKVYKTRSGNSTRHRHRHRHHHSKPEVKTKISEKHYDESKESRGRNGDRREMGEGMYPHPDGYIVDEGADFGHEFYPNNNVLNIVHRTVVPTHVIPQGRSGCIQCGPMQFPIAMRKNMNPPINYLYNTLPGR